MRELGFGALVMIAFCTYIGSFLLWGAGFVACLHLLLGIIAFIMSAHYFRGRALVRGEPFQWTTLRTAFATLLLIMGGMGVCVMIAVFSDERHKKNC